MHLPFRDIVIEKCDDVVIVALPISAVDLDHPNVPIPPRLKSSTILRQREYVAGRLCAQAAILRRTGRTVDVGQDERGLPIWPSNIIGSIAHSTGIACAAVVEQSPNRRIGIDIEGILPHDQVDEVLDVCASPEERRSYSTPIGATTLFSVKESFYKAFAEDLGTAIEFTDVVAGPLASNGVVQLTLRTAIGSLSQAHSADAFVVVEHDVVVTLVRH